MQTIKLDISQKNISPLLYTKQGDVGRKFRVILTDADKEYTIPEGVLFSVWYSGTSGQGNYSAIGENSAFAIDGNTVTVEIITQMVTNIGGGSLCLIMNAADGSQLGLWNIPYIVEEVPGMGSAEAEQYYTALTEVASKAADSAAKAQAAAAAFATDTTFSVKGKAADAEATGAALAGKAPIGMVNGVATIDSIEELAYLVEDNVLEMDDDTVRSFSIRANFSYCGTGMGSGGLLTIHRCRTDDDFISCTAIYTDSTGGYRLRLNGWYENDEWFHKYWDWENPPLLDGIEYQTTERWNGKPVYVMQVSLGAMPKKTSKEYSLPISSQIIPVSYEGYAYNDEAEWPFPVYAAGEIAAYMGYKNDAVYVNATTDLSNFNLRVVVKYTK